MSKKPLPPLRPGTLLMYEASDDDGVVFKREFIIVSETFIDKQGNVPTPAYRGFSSLDGRTTRYSAPIYGKKSRGSKWTILVP